MLHRALSSIGAVSLRSQRAIFKQLQPSVVRNLRTVSGVQPVQRARFVGRQHVLTLRASFASGNVLLC